MDRREFLRTAAAGAALSTVSNYIPLYAQTKTQRASG